MPPLSASWRLSGSVMPRTSRAIESPIAITSSVVAPLWLTTMLSPGAMNSVTPITGSTAMARSPKKPTGMDFAVLPLGT